ncbi:hypothetical protein [Phormidesmis priestleyi]|uniref:hypothetical protein n=1 Tax=Phormidesmis priestleyi TaxID=268141 RepID=UPI00083B44E5|nr:hypothetical protein [Phormidesmis priestleyi]
MSLAFSLLGEALLKSGKLQYMMSKTGEVLPMLVDVDTGKIFEIGRVVAGGFNPVVAPFKLIMDGAQMVQTHRGFQKTYQMIGTLQQSLGVLQTTTAIIGAGVAVTGVLTAVNLYQTLQLREDVKQLRKELNNGFLDIKQVLTSQHTEILQRIDQQTFDDHRRELERAYARFAEATKLVRLGLECQNVNARDNYLANAVQTMSESLAIYNDPRLLPEMNAAGKLRRFECAWTIEQTIALVFQLHNEPIAASKCISDLQNNIKQNTLSVVATCQSQAELDFIFPEITRIHHQDLQVLESWQTQIDVMQALSPRELQQLPDLSLEDFDKIEPEILQIPLEEALYETLRLQTDFEGLRDQLRFMIKPESRQEYEVAIDTLAPKAGYSALVPSNWQDASDLTVANLYWYFNNLKSV